MEPPTIFEHNLDHLPDDKPDNNRPTREPHYALAAAPSKSGKPPKMGGLVLRRVDDPYRAPNPLLGRTSTPRRSRQAQTVQRMIDFAVSVISLLFFFPLFLLFAVAIKLDSPGPVFFTQQRVGYKGASFPLYKFRSMVRDAELLQAQLWSDNERDGPVFKIKNDPRITRAGRMMRKYSLDELPQLLNILKGDMSLVGPRPALPLEVAMYSSKHLQRLDAVPGLTGLWQISGRADLSFEERVSPWTCNTFELDRSDLTFGLFC